MLYPESPHLWQMIDVQALGVKLLQWDMCRVQPVHLKSHQWNIFPQSKLMPQVKISPGDRTRPGPGCPSAASPVPQPRCSSTWSARNPLSGPSTRSPSGRRSAPGQTPCWLFATVIITMKVEIYQYIQYMIYTQAVVMYYLAVVGGEVDERFLWKTWGQSGHAEPLIRATDTDWHLKTYLYCQTFDCCSFIFLCQSIFR